MSYFERSKNVNLETYILTENVAALGAGTTTLSFANAVDRGGNNPRNRKYDMSNIDILFSTVQNRNIYLYKTNFQGWRQLILSVLATVAQDIHIDKENDVETTVNREVPVAGGLVKEFWDIQIDAVAGNLTGNVSVNIVVDS